MGDEDFTIAHWRINGIGTSSETGKCAAFVETKAAEKYAASTEDYGLFDPIDDLTRVKGIGPKTLEKLKAFVTL